MNQKLMKRVGAALLSGVMVFGAMSGPLAALPVASAVETAAQTEDFSVAFAGQMMTLSIPVFALN